MEDKTNVMRLLDKKKISYKIYNLYEMGMTLDDITSHNSLEIANILKINPNMMFKTLVTVSKTNHHYVFVIPCNSELDLKKSAKVVNEKSISMVKSKELLALTGYIHGGCSPIGMKKFFTTTINETAKDFDSIVFSSGKIGILLEVKVEDIAKVIKYSFADVIV
ncbi:MAG: aminoacyl-tRNA deacylase [Oscillospiraceae bacterium]